MTGTKLKWLWLICGITILMAGGGFVLLQFTANKLVFPGQFMRLDSRRIPSIAKSMAPCAKFFTINGETLEAWSRILPDKPLIVYSGGNGEDVLYMAAILSDWNCSFLAVNYRGFGKSTGTPSEKEIISDMESIVKQTVEEKKLEMKNVVLIGQSIGSGVAVQLAARLQAGKLVLLVPFESLDSAAQEKVPFLPASLLLDSHFRSDKLAPGIKCPVFIYAATEDQIIPIEQARRLSRLFPNLKSYREFDNVSHMELMNAPEFQEVLEKLCNQPLQ